MALPEHIADVGLDVRIVRNIQGLLKMDGHHGQDLPGIGRHTGIIYLHVIVSLFITVFF